MPILAPISAGELIDKITILRVKAERIGDVAKRGLGRRTVQHDPACQSRRQAIQHAQRIA